MPCARPAAEIEPVLSIDSSNATLPAPSRRPTSKSSRIVNRVDTSPPLVSYPTRLLRMGEFPIERSGATIERPRLQVASVDAADRRHLAKIADNEDFVGLVEVGKAQGRFARIL